MAKHSKSSAAIRSYDIEALFDSHEVTAVELTGEGNEQWLQTEEIAHIEHAVPKRRREFAAGRYCARVALAALGLEPGPILVGDQRQPLWPSSVVGSITHTDDYCVAVVKPRYGTIWDSIGVDAERMGRVHPDLFTQILGPQEQLELQQLDTDRASDLATYIFSAKEAFYKAQFALTGAWVDFVDVKVEVDGNDLRIERTTDLPALSRLRWPIHARKLDRDGIVVVAVTVSRLTGTLADRPMTHGVAP